VVFFLVSPRWPRERILASVSVDALLRSGEEMERNGNISGAINHYRSVLKLVPDLGRAHARLGLLLLRANQPAEGRREIKEAIRLGVIVNIPQAPNSGRGKKAANQERPKASKIGI